MTVHLNPTPKRETHLDNELVPHDAPHQSYRVCALGTNAHHDAMCEDRNNTSATNWSDGLLRPTAELFDPYPNRPQTVWCANFLKFADRNEARLGFYWMSQYAVSGFNRCIF